MTARTHPLDGADAAMAALTLLLNDDARGASQLMAEQLGPLAADTATGELDVVFPVAVSFLIGQLEEAVRWLAEETRSTPESIAQLMALVWAETRTEGQ